jgi:predicted nucleic acid-binding protein
VRVLFDTNVILDVLLARPPHAESAARLLALVDRGNLEGLLCATTITTIYYLDRKTLGRRMANQHVRGLLARFEVAPVDATALAQALELKTPDYEDAVLHEAARRANAAAIVTRDPKHFAFATLPILDPQELLSAILASDS